MHHLRSLLYCNSLATDALKYPAWLQNKTYRPIFAFCVCANADNCNAAFTKKYIGMDLHPLHARNRLWHKMQTFSLPLRSFLYETLDGGQSIVNMAVAAATACDWISHRWSEFESPELCPHTYKEDNGKCKQLPLIPRSVWFVTTATVFMYT